MDVNCNKFRFYEMIQIQYPQPRNGLKKPNESADLCATVQGCDAPEAKQGLNCWVQKKIEKSLRRFSGCLLFLVLFSFTASGQYVFKGTVVSSEGRQPLQGVTISSGKDVVATTDSNGVFRFNTAVFKPLVQCSHVGYQTKSGVYNSAANPVIVLYRSNAFLAETVVKAFERNTALKNIPVTLSVLGRADLERYGNASVLPAVNTVPGVKMDERSPGSYRLSIRGNLLRSPFGVRNVKVYWNGIPFTDANGTT
jgi:iron complex outermembrane recepter protein